MVSLSSTLQMLFQNPWARFSFTLAGFLAAAILILYVFNHYLRALAAKTKNTLDDEIVDKLAKPLSDLTAVFGIKIAIQTLEFGFAFNTFINNLLNSILVLLSAYGLGAVVLIVINYWGHRYAQHANSEVDTDVLPLLHKSVKILFVIVSILIILTMWEIEIGPLLASLGIAGLALSLALKDTLANVFGGIALIMDKNFKVGDTVQLETKESGKVLDIGLRSTKIRTWDNEVIILPNGLLANAKIVNFAQPDSAARLILDFSVEYGNDPEKVKKVVLKEVEKHEGIEKEPKPFIRFNKMNDFSLDFKAYVWVPYYRQRFMLEDELNTVIYAALRKNKIKVPFPTRTVYMEKGNKAPNKKESNNK